MRVIALFFLLIFFYAAPLMAAAPPAAPEVPEITFEQKVNIVFSTKKDPRVFEMKIDQDKAVVTISLIVDQKVDHATAKKIATDTIMLAKGLSLDDHPKVKDLPGKGLYNYTVTITHPDGIVVLSAVKKAENNVISFEDPDLVPEMEPLTRADANGR